MNVSSEALPMDRIADELSEPLLRYFRRCAGDAAVADDLLQETLIRIAHGLPDFEGRASLKTWAFTIATRVTIDHFRKPGNRARIVEIEESPEFEDGDPPVDERLVVDEMNACVRQVIDSLPEDYRAALVLHDLEGHSAAETAGICGCSVPTAKIRIHRARLRLKDRLREECDFYRDGDSVFRCEPKAAPEGPRDESLCSIQSRNHACR